MNSSTIENIETFSFDFESPQNTVYSICWTNSEVSKTSFRHSTRTYMSKYAYRAIKAIFHDLPPHPMRLTPLLWEGCFDSAPQTGFFFEKSRFFKTRENCSSTHFPLASLENTFTPSTPLHAKKALGWGCYDNPCHGYQSTFSRQPTPAKMRPTHLFGGCADFRPPPTRKKTGFFFEKSCCFQT